MKKLYELVIQSLQTLYVKISDFICEISTSERVFVKTRKLKQI